MLWFGWFGFNAESALSAGSLAGNTLLVSQVASATSAMLDYIVLEKQNREAKYYSRYYWCNSRIGRGDSSLRIYQLTGRVLPWYCTWFSILLYGFASETAP
jgi:hypothetical protein